MWDLTSTGHITVSVIDSSNNVISVNSSLALQLNTWTHIVQTFSSTNGLRLYVDSTLVASRSSLTGHAIGPYLMIGASPNGARQFYGRVDEFRVFRNELTSTDICRLAYPE